ncbi:MAG: AAA family ATPase, partial [Bacteroidota bacterium]
MIGRHLLPQLKKDLFKGKIISILGPRQVGKTTLVRELAKQIEPGYLYLNGDLSSVQDLLSSNSLANLKAATQGAKLVVLDEAQRISDVGLKLKILVDELPEVQLLITGS